MGAAFLAAAGALTTARAALLLLTLVEVGGDRVRRPGPGDLAIEAALVALSVFAKYS